MVEPTDDLEMELGESVPAAKCCDSPSVLISASALYEMNLHAASEPHHEIGGIMLGQVVQGPGLLVIVEDVIRGTKMDHSSGSVTFTHETWSEINRIKDEQFPDSKVVGWYHSHPGFGVFLSGHDLFIHKNFFSQPWQIAFVTDPRAHTCGTFVWEEQGLVQEEFGVLTSAEAFKYPTLAPEPPPEGDESPADAHGAQMVAPRPPRQRDISLLLGLGLLGMLLTMVLLVALTNFLTVRNADKALHRMESKLQVLESKIGAQLQRPEPVQGVPALPQVAPGAPAPQAQPQPPGPSGTQPMTSPPTGIGP